MSLLKAVYKSHKIAMLNKQVTVKWTKKSRKRLLQIGNAVIINKKEVGRRTKERWLVYKVNITFAGIVEFCFIPWAEWSALDREKHNAASLRLVYSKDGLRLLKQTLALPSTTTPQPGGSHLKTGTGVKI